MNGLKLLSALVLLCISFASLAFNPVTKWYMGMIGGATYVPKVNFTAINPLDDKHDKGTFTYNLGGNGGIFFGYRWCNLRLEIEPLFNENGLNQIKLGDFTIESSDNTNFLRMHGYTYFVSGLVNAIYEFYQAGSDRTNFAPYLGVGIGYAYTQSKVRIFKKDNLRGTIMNTDDLGMLQGILGVNYFMDDFTAVGIDYRYMILSKLSKNHGSMSNSFQPQTINLSFTYAFGK
jgi:opacity protein-like surface antigen